MESGEAPTLLELPVDTLEEGVAVGRVGPALSDGALASDHGRRGHGTRLGLGGRNGGLGGRGGLFIT